MSEGYPKYTVKGPVPLLSPGGLNRRITSASGLVRNKSDISLASRYELSATVAYYAADPW